VNFEVYSYDSKGNIVNSNADTEDVSGSNSGSSNFAGMMANRGGMMGGGMSAMMGGSSGSTGAENFSEMMVGSDGTGVSAVITDSYDVLYGAWPQNYDEVVLVLDENNAISTGVLYQLGLITADEYEEIAEKIANGEEVEELNFDYETVCGHTFYLVPACDHYIENEDGTFTYIGNNVSEDSQLLEDALQLKITGVIRPIEDAANASITTAVAYTSGLTDYVITHTNESAVIVAQEADAEVNVLSGMKFEALDDTAKIEDAKTYISSLGVSDKATLYQMILYYSAENSESTEETENTQQRPSSGAMGSGAMDETTMATAMDKWLAETPDDEILLSIYEEYVGGSSYEDNLEAFGKVSYDAPASISIYTDSFEDKEAVAECIVNYNETVDSDTQITYTDYVELMTSSLTTIIDTISYVLIAFVAVSLVVSCIMIGIITHISVLERTKEIGILRALGASKKNISQVFNAETIIVGLCAGLLGVGVSALFTVPINAIIQNLLGVATMSAQLPLTSAIVLVVLSMVITVIGGLIPARKAAKKDPVIALRTE